MKSILLLLAFVAVSYANLAEDYADFLKVIPVGEIRQIVQKHIETDPEYQVVISYIHSPQWNSLVNEIRSKEEIKKLNAFCLSAGLDLQSITKFIYDLFVGFSRSQNVEIEPRTIRELVDEIEEIFPVYKIKEVYYIKMQNSADFKMLIQKLSSDQANKLANEVLAIPEVQRLGASLTKYGINVAAVVQAIYKFFGWM